MHGMDWRDKFVASRDFNIPKGYDFSIHACPYI